MIRDPLFWETDARSPATCLFDRNHNFLTEENAEERIQQARLWLLSLRNRFDVQVEENMISTVDDEAIAHIFEMDAIRTFVSPQTKEKHTRTLSTIYQFTQDYHQGLGFIVAWLLLFFQPGEVVGIVRVLFKGPMVGYFKKEAATLFRDAKVTETLMKTRFPKSFDQLDTLGISAGTYSSKWLVALNLHCLPFECLFTFYGQLFSSECMTRYLFGYSLSVIESHEQNIVATNHVDRILEFLRNDVKVVPDEGNLPFYVNLVSRAEHWSKDITDCEIEQARKQAQIELDVQAAKRQAFLDAEESSDGISFSDED
eukprot:GHVH01007258.1.p1 GENE.GHVH01007258.1~~GHVH01007258.1.p1  ORF type:complete len:313 (+),score=52.48 GHVH01007258.1:112-1050(+)